MKKEIVDELNTYADEKRIPDYMRFFKTEKGEYGYGDKFLGIKVPEIRKVVKNHFSTLSLDEVKEFLYSPYHEHRMFALLVLVFQYKSKRLTSDEKRQEIYEFYLSNTIQINNWDLIDVTCPHIIGVHLRNKKNRDILYKFASSKDLWKKRISIISTFALINESIYRYSKNSRYFTKRFP